MPDDRRFSDEEMERSLRDLGARMEYPPTPDVADTVRRRLEETGSRQSRRTLRLPPFLAPRWTAVAAALVVICVLALSPTLRNTLSGPLAPGSQAGSEAGSEAGSAAKPESGESQGRHEQEPAGAPTADQGEAATTCSSPSIEAVPAQAEAGAKFRLRGHDFSPSCGRNTPSRDIEILFRQDGKTWRLTTLDADRNKAFETRLRVPAGAEPGPARVQAIPRSGEHTGERLVVLR
jgi:hypothetical protein